MDGGLAGEKVEFTTTWVRPRVRKQLSTAATVVDFMFVSVYTKERREDDERPRVTRHFGRVRMDVLIDPRKLLVILIEWTM